MLRTRALSAIVLGVPALLAIIAGGWWYLGILALVIGLAALEWTRLVAHRGHRVFGGLMLAWVGLFLADRVFPDLALLEPGITALLLITLLWMLVRYCQGTVNAATGFAFTAAGGLYLGWGGAHFLGLRALDDGLYWMLTVVLAVWCTDTAAYFVGSAVGRTPLIPTVSPRKTWEGYLAGIGGSVLGAAVMTFLWRALGAGSDVSGMHILALALIASLVGPLGDLGVSVFKRYAGVKDTSRLVPGHGGFLDRTDALIVTGLLGYYYLTLVASVGGG